MSGPCSKTTFTGQATLEWIGPPAESPWEFEEAKERDIDFMTNVAKCADEAELREIRQQGWDLALTEIALIDEQGLFP